MMNENVKLSKTRALAAKLIYAALTILRDNDNEMPMKELVELNVPKPSAPIPKEEDYYKRHDW